MLIVTEFLSMPPSQITISLKCKFFKDKTLSYSHFSPKSLTSAEGTVASLGYVMNWLDSVCDEPTLKTRVKAYFTQTSTTTHCDPNNDPECYKYQPQSLQSVMSASYP